MSRLIQRFTGSQINQLQGVPSIEIMSDDFNTAEAYSFNLKHFSSDGFISTPGEVYYINASCSETTPGVILSVRDTDCSMHFDEQEVAQHIVEELRPHHTGGLWGVNYMQGLIRTLISRFATEKAKTSEHLYQNARFEMGGIVRSAGVPITIFGVANVGSDAVTLCDIIGMRNFDNVREPVIEIYTENGVYKLTHFEDSTLANGNLWISSAVVQKDNATGMIPQEAIHDEQAAKAYLAANQFVREEDTFADIDLF